MKFLILFICSSVISFATEPVFISISHYEGLGNRMRVEIASSYPKCKKMELAQKIYVDKTNELREIGLWEKERNGGKGGWYLVHPSFGNIRKEVDRIFSEGQRGDNPCETTELSVSSNTTSGSNAVPQ